MFGKQSISTGKITWPDLMTACDQSDTLFRWLSVVPVHTQALCVGKGKADGVYDK